MPEIVPSPLKASPRTETFRREAAESALGKSEEILHLLVNAVRDYAIFALDPQGWIQTWNAGARRLKGYEHHEVVGTHFSRFYTPEDIARRHPWWELEQAAEHGTYEEEGWRVRKDGSRFWVSIVITALHAPDGTLRAFGKVTRDLTERKRAEDALQTAYRDLEARVQARTAELALAKDQAERAVRARDEFLSIASHELRTPLTSLKLKSELARRKLRTQADPSPAASAMAAYVHSTDEQIDRLARLTEDMLDMTRISQGTLALLPETLDLGAAARSSVDRMRDQFEEKRTPIDCDVRGSVLIAADPLRIEQVIVNLLSNALRYAPGSPVHVRVWTEGTRARLSVQDHGPGIAPESQEQIFNRYERLAPSESVHGLGIGLYLSRSIVRAHDGRIFVESELGQGARFVVDLPRATS